MIRRGLQILGLVGITALGAASARAQEYPPAVTMTGFPLVSGVNVNGYYVKTGTTGAFGATGQYTLYDAEENALVLEIRAVLDGANVRWGAVVRTSSGANPILTRVSSDSPVLLNGWTVMSGWRLGSTVTGALVNGSTVVDQDFPYSSEFPDWESAAVKIPLGFSLAMSFWAVCVAAAISMRWVRDLASAAT